MIRPLAASRLVFWAAALSFENWSLDTEPPFSARRVATFCRACVNTATETSPSSNAPPVVADPMNELRRQASWQLERFELCQYSLHL